MSARRKEHKDIRAFVTYAIVVCALILFWQGCKKDTASGLAESDFKVDKLFERGPLAVHVRLDKDKITIAETCLLQFEASIGPKYEVQMPQVGTELQNFGILDWDNLGDRLDENNNVVSTYQYRLEPFLSGNYQLPAFTFQFSDANSLAEKKYTLTTEPIDIEVTSLLGEDRENLTIADIADVVDMPRQASFWPVWILVGCALITVAIVWFFLRRKRAIQLVRIFRPAHEIAYARLKSLVKDDLVAAGKIKEFYERISDILRHYIEHRFDLRAPERTTEEFLAEPALTDILGGNDKKMLEEFLTHCDLVKFAKHDPTHQQIQRTFDLLREFIEKTKSDERKIDVTDNVQTPEPVEVSG